LIQRHKGCDFMIKKISIPIILISTIVIINLLLLGSSFSADKDEILTIGEGKIKGNNTADARKEAISNALKKAMEEYLAAYLGSQGMVNNFPALIENIIPSAGDEIENYHIVTEEKKDEDYNILVRVKVNKSLMQQKLKDIGIVSVEGTAIKVLFLVSQETSPGGTSSYWWKSPENATALTATELGLYNLFQDQGLQPINRLSGAPDVKYTLEMKSQDLSDEQALGWGKFFSADVVLKGKTRSTSGNMVTVDLDAISVEDGVSICRSNVTEPMNPGDNSDTRFSNALQAALTTISNQFGPEIIKYFKKSSREYNKVLIEFKELTNFEEFQTLKKFFEKEISGVKSITQSRVRGQSIIAQVEFSGSKDIFISRIKGIDKLPLKANIASTSDGNLLITINHEMTEPVTGQDSNSL
jgi:hypothetical protein